jgi:hypothetical protein
MRIILVDALFKPSASVGAGVGEGLGALVGLDVGLFVGPLVGLGVGALIGDFVLGLRVGVTVRVGAGTGATDGFRVAATTVMLDVSTSTVVLNALLALLWKEGELSSVCRAEDKSSAELTPPRSAADAATVKDTDHVYATKSLRRRDDDTVYVTVNVLK